MQLQRIQVPSRVPASVGTLLVFAHVSAMCQRTGRCRPARAGPYQHEGDRRWQRDGRLVGRSVGGGQERHHREVPDAEPLGCRPHPLGARCDSPRPARPLGHRPLVRRARRWRGAQQAVDHDHPASPPRGARGRPRRRAHPSEPCRAGARAEASLGELRAVADVLGHSPDMLLRTYAHALPDSLRAVSNLIGGRVAGWGS